MPTALVTDAPERVSDIAIALKSAGFDILAARTISAEDVPDLATELHGPTATILVVSERAAVAEDPPPEPLPWWLYASVDPDLDFADWRNSVLCLMSLSEG